MKQKQRVVVIQTGVANMASVVSCLEKCGAEVIVTHDPEVVRESQYLVLPGVGAFGPAIRQLREYGLAEIIRTRINENLPTLAVCLGLQLLANCSEEAPGECGLGVYDARIEKFKDVSRVPQLGWNEVKSDPRCALLQSGWAYFANSYRLTCAPDGWTAAWSDYGGPFVAAMEKGRTLACQFHPELSGPWGLELIKRWLGDKEC